MNFRLDYSTLASLSPVRMAAYMGLGTLVVMFGVWLFAGNADAPWEMAMSGLLLYSWLVTVVSFFSTHFNRHTLQSVACYFGLLLVLGGVAYGLTRLSIFDLPEYQLFLSAMTLFYVVAIVLSRGLRSLAAFIERN